jgi:hypothetical protein
MMQAKRTDGPWYVDTGVDGIVIKQAATQQLIASLNPTSRAQADAHMIATAPAMFDALRRILAGREVRDPYSTDGSTIVASLPIDEIEAICSAAIAKASGASS